MKHTRHWPIAGFALLFLLPFVWPLVFGDFKYGANVTDLFIMAIAALGLNVVIGYTGLLHLGIAAFVGIGAYLTGILTVHAYPFQFGFLASLLVATLGAAAAGAMLGAPTLRLRGDYLALVTLGFGEVAKFTLRNLEEITDGTRGLNPVPRPTSLENFPWLNWSNDYRCFYYLCLTALVVVLLVLRNLERSQVGREWMALREDELAATCMGLNANRVKISAFALGAGLAGFAGCLYATKLGTTSQPDAYDFSRSISLLCCIILGGMGSLRGTVMGVFILIGFDTILAPILDTWLQGDGGAIAGQASVWMKWGFLTVKNWRYLIFGVALVLMMRFRPEGLFPSRRIQNELHTGT